jgi:hydroxysqualene dehydroxylase
MNQGTIHIVGAGLAGLSAATALAGQGRRAVVHEAAGQAGGRCRSYHDAAFGATIDNGNHLLLSGNHAALAYLRRIGAGDALLKNAGPAFDFADAKAATRWQLRLSKGRIPFWLFDKNRRVPDTKPADYLSVLRLLTAGPQQTITPLLPADTPLYRRLWHPVLLSALNTQPDQGSAKLAAAILRETLLKGGSACMPLVAEGLSSVFIDPALRYLAAHGASVGFNRRLRSISFENGAAVRLEFAAGDPVPLAASDAVICAVPPWIMPSLLPGVDAPDDYRAILNAHFRVAASGSLPRILGVINATVEWIFAFPDRISITVSDAGRLMQEDRETLAARLWGEVAGITGLATRLPAWQIVKEKRATFAATPEQDAKRPDARTKWSNVYLAGDYVQNGLPATIEGTIRSGMTAAGLVMRNA